jgi:hypothetical protein
MTDPWPSHIRMELEAARREGRAFPAAWTRAIKRWPAPGSWRCGGEGCSPYAFAKRMFGLAYARIPLPGSVTPTDARSVRPPRSLLLATTCRWGDGCGRRPVKGRRFCPEHTATLAAIQLSPYEGAREYEYLAS